MFIHNLKYTIKTLFKNKVLIFWTFAFPIVLGLFFNMAFSNIEKDEKLQVFDIAVVMFKKISGTIITNNRFKNKSPNGLNIVAFSLKITPTMLPTIIATKSIIVDL